MPHLADQLPSLLRDLTATSPVWRVTGAHLGLCDDMLAGDAAGFVEQARNGAEPVVPVFLHGARAFVGPVAIEGMPYSPCDLCFARRWQALQGAETRWVLEQGGSFVVRWPSPYVGEFACDALRELCGQAVDRAVAAARRRDASDGPPAHHAAEVVELRLDTLETDTYPLIADPGCPACGPRPGESRRPGPLSLVSRRKPSPHTYRLRSPRALGLPERALVNPVCGVVASETTYGRSSTTTASAVGTFRMCSPFEIMEFTWGGHSDNFRDSETIGVLEGMERHAGLWPRDPHDPVEGAYSSLRADALDPRDCGLYDDDFYRRNPESSRPFDPDEVIRWRWGHSLRDHRAVLVPEELIYYGSNRLGGRSGFVTECSNGCASGSCLEEAVLHGMLELIERDAFVVGWFGKARLPEIDPMTCTDPRIVDLAARLDMLGYDARLFDNRIDLSVPVVTAVAQRHEPGPGNLAFAAGSSFDPETAALSALREVSSHIPVLSGRVRERETELAVMATDFPRVVTLDDHAHLFATPRMQVHADFVLANGPRRSMAEQFADWDALRPNHDDLLDDLRYCQHQITGLGSDVVVVDQTTAEQRFAGQHTACVIAPGLVPIDFGWDRQRALTLPRTRTAFVRAGWRTAPLRDSELNHAPHPFP